MKLCFIGAGKMATALAGGLIRSGVLRAADMIAADTSPVAATAFTAATAVRCLGDGVEACREADAVLLAVKPQAAAETVAALAASCRGKLVISIAAGLRLERLAHWLGQRRIVRVMPNTPLLVTQGATAFACDTGVTEADRQLVATMFRAVGLVVELPEAHMDAVTALSGSGPAYVFELIQGLVDAGVSLGLPADVALALTAQTVAGAAAMVQQGIGTPDELRRAVTSPGGTTAAGLAVFEAADFRGLLRDVLKAARQRSAELGG